MAIKEWNEGDNAQIKEETLKGPLFNNEEINQIKFELSGKKDNQINDNIRLINDEHQEYIYDCLKNDNKNKDGNHNQSNTNYEF